MQGHLKTKGTNVAHNGLIMVSRMGMVVKTGAFGAPLRLQGLTTIPILEVSAAMVVMPTLCRR
jgi:hypothetical protein